MSRQASDHRQGVANDGHWRAGCLQRAMRGQALLEREEELAELDLALEEAAGGLGQLVMLEAPAGLGKSALLEECRRLATSRGSVVVSGRASERERDFPFGVVVQLFEQRLHAGSSKERARLLSGAAVLCRPLFDAAAGDEVRVGSWTQGEAPHGVLHGLYWLCANIAADAPLVVVVDDIHWADAPSRLFLSYLLRRIDGLRVLVVLASRPPDPALNDDLLQEISRAPAARILHPGPLTDAGTAALIRATGSVDPSDRFARACRDVTLGNPMLLRELLLELATQGVPPDDAGAEQVRRVGPANVSRLILQRLARLPAAAQALARAAAVLGDRAELRHCAALCRLEQAEAADAADALVRVEVLQQSGSRLRFVHPIVLAAIYSEMPTAERAGHHAHAARLLDADQAPPDQVAVHAAATFASGDPWVADVLRSAADRALAQGTPAAAISYLRRALDEPPPPDALPEILARLGAAESRVRDPRAIEHLTRAFELTHTSDGRATIALELGRALTMAGRLREAIKVLTDAAAPLGKSNPDLRLRVEAELLEAARLSVSTRPIIAERLESLRGRAQGTWPADRLVDANLAYEAVIHGEHAAHAAELATKALGAGALLADEGSESHTFYYAVWTLALCDRLAAAEQALDAAITDARAHGSALGFGLASCFRSNVYHRAGRLGDAEADARAALSAAGLQDLGPSLPFATAFLADALLDRGEFDEAAEVLGHVDAIAAEPDSIAVNPLLFSRGRLRLERGEVEEGLSDLLEAGRRGAAWGARTPAFLPWRSTAALALGRLGRIDDAVALADEEVALARSFGAPRALAIALCASGMLARGKDSIERFAEACSALEGSPAQLERARALVEYGSALRRANHRTAAKERLREGLRVAERCGAKPIAEHSRDELAATGARPRRAEYRDALTPSERRVAQMAATGMGNRDIAQALFVTEKTVEWHLRQAYRKLDVHSRHDLPRALSEEAHRRRSSSAICGMPQR